MQCLINDCITKKMEAQHAAIAKAIRADPHG